MVKQRGRHAGEGYCIQILVINGMAQEELAHKSFYIENISKGGFRFIMDIELNLEDRMEVLLRFPDEHTQKVTGRICYRDILDEHGAQAYGFSVIDGFYSLTVAS